MAVVTLTSAINTSPSRTLPLRNKNSTLRDVCSSLFLNSPEESFVRKVDSSQNLVPIIGYEVQKTNVERKKEDDEEIGVFGAEKYFKGGMDEDNPKTTGMSANKHQHKKDERVVRDPWKYKIKPRTPSVQSESSCNSQKALLQSSQKNLSRTNTNKGRRKGIFAGLGCRCYCSGKDSVEIKEHGEEISFSRSASSGVVQGKERRREQRKNGDVAPVDSVRVQKPGRENRVKEEMQCQKLDVLGAGFNRENCFSFPTANSGVANLPTKMKLIEEEEEEEEKRRKSIEVFGSPVMEMRNKSSKIERKLTMLSWDATPRLEEIEFSAPSGGTCNDTESDGSSDLFEIESLTGKANPFLATQDAPSGCVTPTTGYAPSEASIEWSVITASAADFSVMSDCEELRPATITSKKQVGSSVRSAEAESYKEIQRRRSGISLGCKSQKAVQIAGDVYRMTEKTNNYPQVQHRSDSFVPAARSRPETMSTGFSSRREKHPLAARPLRRSQAPRAPHLLYIQ